MTPATTLRVVLVAVCACSWVGVARGDEASDSHRADVTRFGAVANDNLDDTEAILKAVAWAQEPIRRKQIRPRGSSGVCWQPTIWFPAGRYRVSRQIRLVGNASLSSDAGRAVIEWVDDPAAAAEEQACMFLFDHCYVNRVENLIFVGGRTHLHFQNQNVNQTMIDIAGCEFQHATEMAVRATPSGAADHLSALLTIRNCKFMHNRQCLETFCDISRVENVWVEFYAPFCAMDQAVFVNRSGFLQFENMVGVPGVCKNGEAMRQPHRLRWVDNHGDFSAMRSRFGGEGMPAVYHYTAYRDGYPSVGGGTIHFSQCSLYVGSLRADAAVLRLFALPSQVTIQGCRMVNAPIFVIDPSFDVSQAKEAIAPARRRFHYLLHPNLTYPRDLVQSIPEPLREFVVNDAAAPDTRD